MSDSNSISTAVIKALSQVEDVEPTDLDFVLYDYIDPDLLDALATDGRGDWEFDFAVESHMVTIDSDGHVIVDGHVYRAP